MEAYLDASDLWEAVEDEYMIDPLPENPTLAQIKNHKVKKHRKSKAKSYLFSAVSEEIFTRIMTLKSAKEIWDFLKQEYEGNEKIKGMQVLNLIREFEMQQMKESETMKEYSDKLLSIVNNVRLLGTEFSDTRIVQKILVTVPERFESTILSLENSKDLSNITLSELVYALQAQEQRRLMREEGTIEELFKELDKTIALKVTIGNGENVDVKGKGVVAVKTLSEWKQTAIHASPSVVETSNKEKFGVENLQGQNFETAKGKFDDNVIFSVKKCESLVENLEMCNVAMINPLGDANVANMDGWRVVMQKEKNMKEKNESWQFEDKTREQKLIDVKLFCTTKLDHNGAKNKFQEKLVDKGFQEHEVHFSNDFAEWRVIKGQVLKLRKSTKSIREVEKFKEEEFEVNNY
ncbi:hypothetical protein TSUD_296970 [Trifolium subterraneum]|uniref:Reverse transcriptase Ty1/copia-type domain-containing protein n=1 Tax=Trifolium subterraneum TaxID=3900 RepID=A0A2Z6NX56_TRISU|nr:hypothetical protein TSUD_296970 [Trifolium subterraneum]